MNKDAKVKLALKQVERKNKKLESDKKKAEEEAKKEVENKWDNIFIFNFLN